MQYKEPWPGRPFRSMRVVTFRLRGGLPRGVAVLGARRLGLSGIEIPHRCSLSVNQNWQQVETAADWIQLQLAWPEAALPRCAGVMVVPSLRRPASRCRGSWRPPAGAQLHLHTCVKGSAQAVKPDVCRCAASNRRKSSRRPPSALYFSRSETRFDPRLEFQKKAPSRRRDRAQKVSFPSSCRRIISAVSAMPLTDFSSTWRHCRSPHNS